MSWASYLYLANDQDHGSFSLSAIREPISNRFRGYKFTHTHTHTKTVRGGDTNGNLHTQNTTDRKHVGSGSELHKHVGSGSENLTYEKEPLDSLVRLEDDWDEGFIKVESRSNYDQGHERRSKDSINTHFILERDKLLRTVSSSLDLVNYELAKHQEKVQSLKAFQQGVT
jgi:hypothetical protein